LFRKQPILATALTAGAVDGLIGSVDDRIALALFGFAVATGALSLRWLQLQRMPSKLPEQAAVVYLKADTSEAFYGSPTGDFDSDPNQFPTVDDGVGYSALEE
jgi:hypothetical protein